MRRQPTLIAALGVILLVWLAGCGSSDSGSGEHDTESGEHSEESGTQFALSETFDEVRAGARLVLSYDPSAKQFTGTVENTTNNMLNEVRYTCRRESSLDPQLHVISHRVRLQR